MARPPLPDGAEGTTSSLPPVDTASYTRSEATRLLSAGAYLDPSFRRTAITELVEHPERIAPPSLGYDAVTVLRHCLRARSMDVKASVLVLAVLVSGAVIAVGLMVGGMPDTELMSRIDYALPGEAAQEAPSGEQTDQEARAAAEEARAAVEAAARVAPSAGEMGLAALVSLVLLVLVGLLSRARQKFLGRSESLLTVVIGGAIDPARPAHRFLARLLGLANLGLTVLWILPAWAFLRGGHILAALAVLFLPVLLLAIGVWHRLALSRVLWTELSRSSFTGRAPRTPLFARRHTGTLDAIGEEQFSRLVLYNEDQPFLGAGESYRPWSLALELERLPGAPHRAEPLDGRRVLDLITPQLARLAEVSSQTSRDRLKDLELQECVFLPAALPEGVWHADRLYEESSVREHLEASVGEGAEQRRHFLRIRVGGWDEEVVTTVFVRVHTQGDLLILEVLPYVLSPLRSSFHEVDAITARSARFPVSALVTAPAMTVAVLVRGAGTLKSWWFEWFGLGVGETQEAPRLSIRESGSRDTRSMFQEMDVNRYVKTIQDRITSGAQQALVEAGYRTEEFQQRVVNISRGGVFIGGSMSGSIATGAAAKAVTDLVAKKKRKGEEVAP
ncbi:hypothetical protein OUQ99_17380 [Streptomonospora nanhaiensis]|uniref:Uncharacterized protein n=1 Tax=Streptomonospora nanhaiensis TaxID=1323731 RepID=A0ABY6YFK2_9ACTN|nr:hypothetical protein [Streptomonospora nanhaiensis]WAE71008.1 hypothetical protein OUQ99_17380 [Streptomonospora nanhaiensis]